MRFKENMIEDILSRDFDFSRSKLIGLYDTYSYVRQIGNGNEGIVLLYKSDTTDRDIVFKIHDLEAKNNSSKPKNESLDATFETLQCECDFMKTLSLLSHISSFYEHLQSNHKVVFDDKNQCIVDGKVFMIGQFIRDSLEYRDMGHIQTSDCTVFPIIEDFAQSIVDLDSNKSYIPLFKVPNQLRFDTFKRSLNLDSNFKKIPLYSHEEGDTLDKVLISNRGIEDRERIVKELIRSIGILHYFGYIHRDLKPENLILTKNGKIKILDFSLTVDFYPSDRIAKLCSMEENFFYVPLDYYEDYSSKDDVGSRFFLGPEVRNNDFRKKGYNHFSNKIDILAVGILSSLLINGTHPYISGDYISFINDSDKKAEYFNLLHQYNHTERTRNILHKMAKSVLENSNSELLHNISDMFDLDFKALLPF
jgi:serine/threonine protein kinase